MSEAPALSSAGIRTAPSAAHVVRAIARRELTLAFRRKLVRLLFLGSLVPPIIMTVILLARIMAEQMTGTSLDFNPLVGFLQFQALPVALLCLGLGAPGVSRDRAEDVLFLYATRPVKPWHYALGKILAVALPAAALMFLPGFLIAGLRFSVTSDLNLGQSAAMTLRMAVASVLIAWGYAGATVGPSAITKRARWSLLLALALFAVPDAMAGLLTGGDAPPIGPGRASGQLLAFFFGRGEDVEGWVSMLVLMTFGGAGFWVTSARVRTEMIP